MQKVWFHQFDVYKIKLLLYKALVKTVHHIQNLSQMAQLVNKIYVMTKRNYLLMDNVSLYHVHSMKDPKDQMGFVVQIHA